MLQTLQMKYRSIFYLLKSAGKKMLQMIHSLHLHRLKTDHADNKLVCNLSVLGKTDLLVSYGK